MNEPNRLLTTGQVADMLNVTVETVRRWTRDGDLRAVTLSYHTVRYRQREVERFIRRRERGSPPPPPSGGR